MGNFISPIVQSPISQSSIGGRLRRGMGVGAVGYSAWQGMSVRQTKGGGRWRSRGHEERSRNALNPTAPECPRWYRSKTFLLGLFGLSCLFWLWVDSAQIATRLVAASERPSGFLCLQSGYGFVSLTIQASEAGEIPSMYWRKRTSVGMSDGPRFSPPSAVNPSRWHFEVSLPVLRLGAWYLLLWSGLLLWRAWRVRTRRGVALKVDPA